jgi:hypothetical protein
MIRDPHHVAGLEHESHGVLTNEHWFLLSLACLLEDCDLWAMSRHAGVETACSWAEPILLGIVDSRDVAHELRHGIPVIVGWSEGVLSHQPPWGKDHEVNHSLPWVVTLASQHSENAWVWMIIADRTNRVKLSQVILIGSKVSMPSNHVEGGMVLLVLEEFTGELADYLPLFAAIFVPCNWCLEMHWISQAVRTNWAEVWQHEMRLIGFTDPSSRGLRHLNLKLDASLDDADLLRLDTYFSKLCGNGQGALLWDNEHIAISRVESLLVHAGITAIGMDAETVLHGWVSSSTHRLDAINKCFACLNLHGFPSKLLWV